MFALLTGMVLVLRSALNTRAARETAILVLRHQLMVLNRILKVCSRITMEVHQWRRAYLI
jgi:hypothetical protein